MALVMTATTPTRLEWKLLAIFSCTGTIKENTFDEKKREKTKGAATQFTYSRFYFRKYEDVAEDRISTLV